MYLKNCVIVNVAPGGTRAESTNGTNFDEICLLLSDFCHRFIWLFPLQVLEAEIKAMHGLSLQTAVPSSSAKQKWKVSPGMSEQLTHVLPSSELPSVTPPTASDLGMQRKLCMILRISLVLVMAALWWKCPMIGVKILFVIFTNGLCYVIFKRWPEVWWVLCCLNWTFEGS